jgi:hypothetical protein
MTRRIPLRSLALASLILAGTACGDDGASSPNTSPDTTVNTSEPSTPPTTSTPSTPTTPGTPSSEPSNPPTSAPTPGTDDGASNASGTDAAIADLAQRLGVEEAAISVKSEEEVTWRDGSAGCPEPGMMYTQALVPGRRLILTADGKDYAYHSAQGEYFYCEKPAADGTAPEGAGGTD